MEITLEQLREETQNQLAQIRQKNAEIAAMHKVIRVINIAAICISVISLVIAVCRT